MKNVFECVMYSARSYRDGAADRVACGGSLGDEGYALVYESMAGEAETFGEVWDVDPGRVYDIFVQAAQRGADAAQE